MGNYSSRQSYMLWEGLSVVVAFVFISILVVIVLLLLWLCKRKYEKRLKYVKAGDLLLRAGRCFTKARDLLPTPPPPPPEVPWVMMQEITLLAEVRDNLSTNADSLRNIGNSLKKQEKTQLLIDLEQQPRLKVSGPENMQHRHNFLNLVQDQVENQRVVSVKMGFQPQNNEMSISQEDFSNIVQLLRAAKELLVTAARVLKELDEVGHHSDEYELNDVDQHQL